jgi:3-deoxy-D-manno-octulosonic-acid transferase
MKPVFHYFYNIVFLPLAYTAFHILSFFNSKIKKGMNGRVNLFSELASAVEKLPTEGPRFWIHNSSMGEFEQAKPLIKLLKRKFPQGCVIVSFYSPSGFEHARDKGGADHICYLPFDSRYRADRFLSLIRPDVAIVIRHDIWPNHLYLLKNKSIPTLLINCSVFSRSYLRWAPVRNMYRYFLGCFKQILTVSKDSKDLLKALNLGNIEIDVVGDTRYDQVIARAKEAEYIVAPLRKVKGERICFVVGSSWPMDENVVFETLARLYENGIHIWTVLVPHEPIEDRINQIEQKISDLGMHSIRFSHVESGKHLDGDILIVDKVGILASLYALAEVSYVGGGFGVGIHNILEPAALGKAVIFGPRFSNSYEAGQLKKRGVGFSVKNSDDLFSLLYDLLMNPKRLNELGAIAAKLVAENAGATERIVNQLEALVQ